MHTVRFIARPAKYLMALSSLSLLWAPTVSSSFGTLFQLRQAKPVAISTGLTSTANALATSAFASWIKQHQALTIATTVAAVGLVTMFAYLIKKYRDNQPPIIPPAPPVDPDDFEQPGEQVPEPEIEHLTPIHYLPPHHPFRPGLTPIPEENSLTSQTTKPTSFTSSQAAGSTSTTTLTTLVAQPTQPLAAITAPSSSALTASSLTQASSSSSSSSTHATPGAAATISTQIATSTAAVSPAPIRAVEPSSLTVLSSSNATSSSSKAISRTSDAQRVRVEQQQREQIQKQQTQVPQEEIDSWLGLAKLSATDRTVRLQQLKKWHDAGRQFLRMIHKNHDVEHVPTEEDLRNLSWFFYINAGLHERNNFFEEGTFRIIDTTQQASKTIKALYEVFELFAAPRASSHLQEYPHTDFGIDVGQLPANKIHLLLALLTPNCFYLKPENYGVTGVKNGLLHLWEWAVAQVRKTPLAKPLGMRSDSSEGWRKERAEILDSAKSLLKRVASVRGSNEQPRKQAIKDYIDFFTKVLPEITDRNEILAQEIKAFIDCIIKKYPDTWQERIGNEVILSIDELLNAPDIEINGDFLRIRR